MKSCELSTSGSENIRVRICCLDCQKQIEVAVNPSRSWLQRLLGIKPLFSPSDTLKVAYVLRRHSGHRISTEEVESLPVTHGKVWEEEDIQDPPPPWHKIPSMMYQTSDVLKLQHQLEELKINNINLQIEKQSLMYDNAMREKDMTKTREIASALVGLYSQHAQMRNDPSVSEIKRESLATWTIGAAEMFGIDKAEVDDLLVSVGLSEFASRQVSFPKATSAEVENYGIVSLDAIKQAAKRKAD